MSYHERITLEPGKRAGKPCIRGLRITAYDVLEMLANGMSSEEIIADFPELDLADIRACLAFAADRKRRMVVLGRDDPLLQELWAAKAALNAASGYSVERAAEQAGRFDLVATLALLRQQVKH
jgi:uncharacterized protein (DUF433 family)